MEMAAIVAILQDVDTRILAFTAALLVGVAVYLLARSIRVALLPPPERALEEFLGGTRTGPVEQIGSSLLRRVPALGDILDARHNHRWAVLGGDDTPLEFIIGIAALQGAGVFLFALIFMDSLLIAPILALAAAGLPLYMLADKAQKAQERVRRQLPMVEIMIAAEMAAGRSVEQALERAKRVGGPIAQIIQEAETLALSRGIALLGRMVAGIPTGEGALRRVARKYGMPELLALAAQLELAASKGTKESDMMRTLAQTSIIEQRGRMMEAVENMDTWLAILQVVFFLVPMIAIVLAAMLVPFIASVR